MGSYGEFIFSISHILGVLKNYFFLKSLRRYTFSTWEIVLHRAKLNLEIDRHIVFPICKFWFNLRPMLSIQFRWFAGISVVKHHFLHLFANLLAFSSLEKCCPILTHIISIVFWSKICRCTSFYIPPHTVDCLLPQAYNRAVKPKYNIFWRFLEASR